MNKTYRTVWNPTTGTWVAAAETARARKKSNSTMRSSVTAAVAVMAGFGGGAIAIDAEAQTANGNGALNLCGGANGAVGHTFGYSASTTNANCAAIGTNNPTYGGRAPSFVLGNGGDLNGASGPGSTGSTASVAGSRDGHLMIYGANGVHVTGTTDFANTVSMTNNRIQNLAAGTVGTDAVNLNQLNAAIAATDNQFVAFSTGPYAANSAATVGTNNSATAVGPNASATGTSAVALGGNTVATAQNAVALGTISRATGAEATAVGVGAAATGASATALGRGAAATGNNSTALGTYASAVGTGNLAVGGGAAVAQTGRFVPSNMIAIGTGARAIDGDVTGANGSIAIGNSATAGGTGSIVIGTNARHSGSSATVLGGEASAMGGGAGVAVGYGAMASGSSGVSLGTNSTASAASSIALGTNSVANRANAVSVGSTAQQRQITNVAVGTEGTDAVNVNQLNAAIAAADDPYVNVRSGTYAPAVAAQAGNSATAIGANASAAGTSAVALGGSSMASADNAVALGTRSEATGINSIAAGVNSHANANNTVALGSLSVAGATNATAVGNGANASAINTVALGQSSVASGASAIGIGFRANAQADNSVALGAGSVANRINSVSVGNVGSERQITNLAAGTVGTDAVNLAQLNAAIATVDGNSPYFKANGAGDGSDAASATGAGAVGIGSNAKALAAGGVAIGSSATAGMANSIAIGNDVIAAQDGVAIGQGARAQNANATAIGTKSAAGLNGTALGTNAHAVTDAVALGVDATAAGGNSVALGNGSIAASNTVSVGSVGNERKITNVADGALSNTSTDAVNGSQLFATNTRVGSLEDSLKGGGVIDPDTGESLAVVYDTTAKDKVTLGGGTNGTTLANVKAGVADTDAVNVSQLKGSGLIGDDGKAIAAVTYDRNANGTPNYGSVTLGDGTNPTQLKHVADATDDSDALNLGQLKDSGLVGDDGKGNLTSLAVTYDSATKDTVTLGGGTDGTTLANVKAGVADTDAVNVSQLKGSGLIGDDGNAIAAVTYNRNADGTPNYNAVTLGGGKSTGPVTLSNVAAGVAATDAVNVQQLQQSVANGNPYIGGRGTGVAAQATGLNAIALGLGSVADEIRTVSVGNSATGLQRRITNVQNGEADSDAATVGQVNDLMGIASTNTQTAIDNVNTTTKQAIQDVNSRLDAIGTLAGTDPYVQVDGLNDGSDNAFVRAGTYGVAIGAEASATGDTSIAIGAQSGASGSGSVALGAGASATGTGAVAFGSGVATGTSALALGNGTNASGNNAVAAGFNARAAGVNALAFGNTARANAADSMAFGTSAQVDPLATNSIAIGRQSSVTGTALNSVALGASSVADRLNSISVGSTGQQRQIIYVARGTANTDAVNVSQLKDAVAAFGGNASVGADGSITNPTYTIGGTTYRNVGDALNALSNLGGGGTDPLAVTYGTNGDGSPNFEVVTLKGTDGTTLANVKAGVADKDAVNVSQLKDSGLIGDDGKAIAAVTYDRNADGTPNLGSVTLGGGTDGTTLANVKAGVADKDAVNVSQLKGSGLIGDDGKAIAAVTYDRNADGTPNLGSVTLGGGTDGTTLANVKAGVADKDAVNVSQLKGSGLIGDDGKSIAAVTYDRNADGTPNLGSVTLGGGTDGTTLANVKAGVADKDAVNVSQLKGSGLIGDDGKSIAAVTYDRNADGTPNYGSVTLGDGTNPTQLKHVADATDDSDALNLGQLKNAGLVGDDGNGNLTSLAVTYDSATKDTVTLGGGTDGTTLANVKAGVADKDAVNVSQLKGSGLIGDDGKAIAAVTYDRNADGTPNLGSVTLGGGTDGTTLANVKAGVADKDAVNVSQLKGSGLIGDDGKAIAAVTYDRNADGTPNLGSVTLGGGTDGTTLANVKAGVADKDAVNVSQLKGSGLIGDDGKAIAAVTYDRNADGTPNLGSVTLGGGTDGTTLANVKAGVADKDAVNVSQLKDSGLIGGDGKAIAAVTYDRNVDGTPNYGSVTLGDGTNPTQLKHVADATDDSDALNLGQLKDAGLVGDDGKGNLTSLAVVYDSATKDTVTLGGGTDGTTLANVKAGVADKDAVNVSQLKGSGLIGDDGKAIAAVTYNRNTDGTPNYNAVTLGAGKSTGAVTLSNVAEGVAGTDAVNVDQLTAAIKDLDIGLNPLAVSYDTASKDKVTLGGAAGTTLANVKAGVADTDAVNVSQLKDSGLIGDDGKAIAAVTYDRSADGTPNLGSVTLGGGTDGTTLANVKAGVADKDAVNVSQLKGSGLIGDDGKSIAAVTYDRNADGTPNLGSVTLGGGTDGTTLANVKAGVADKDAVNVSQLKGSGLIGDDGKAIAAVTYDRNADGTPNYGSVTLGDGTNPTQLKHVADATDDSDALNLGQLKNAGLVGDDGNGNLTSLAVTYDSATKDTVTLGGGTDGTTLANVKAGVADKDAVNVSQLKDSGLIGGDGKAIAAVTYDRNADGTPNYGSVTLGDGTNPTQLKHVADATDDNDALNLGQLKNAGLVGDDGNGNLTSLAVTYDSATKDTVTLGGGTNGTTLANVKAGVADKDAVNVSQLKGSGLIGDDGQAIAAVTYNRNADGTPNYDAVTLGGGKSAGPVTLSNVADGVDRHDAVNLGQLQDSGLVAPVDPTNPGAGLTSLAVTYGKNADGSANFDEVKLMGTNGTTLANVKAGVADTDAVNVSQLKRSGLIGDDGQAIAAVTYNRNADGTPNYDAVTLGGGKSAGPVTLSNVADGVDRHDAVNLGQLQDSGLVAPVDPTNPGAGLMSLAVTYGTNDDGSANFDEVKLRGADGTTLTNVKAGAVNTASTDAVNGSQLYGVSKSVADSLGGGSTVDANGNVTAPTYSLTDPANVAAKADYRNVGDALDNLDGRVATNTKNITVINNQLADSGLVDPVTGQSIAAVTYDRNADGTPNYSAVTLGGGKSAGPVQLKNVAAGTDDTDAVNVAQLKSAGLVAPVDPTNPGSGLTSLAVTYSTNDDESANFDEVKLKGTNGTTLTNVAAGAVNATSTDAINGSQLHGTAQSVADTIGGGTTVDADGTLANTAIEVKGQKYSTVAEAVQAAAAYGATDSLAVRYDLNSDGTPNFGSVTLGGSGAAPVRLTNVADGTSQYDAVNYGQLSALNDKIGNLDDRVGGLELRPGTPGDGNGGGTGTNPYFGATDQTAGGSSAANPGTGTGNVAAGSGSSIGTGVNDGTAIGSGSTVAAGGGTAIGAGSAAKGENATAIGQGSNATGSGSVAIGSGSVANEANTVSFGNGTDTGNRRIVNIADGVGANDAATKGQLDRAVGGLGSQINDVSKNAYSGIAAATALTMIPGVDPGKTLSFGVGGATYKGYQAVAFGGEARITQNLKMKAGVGLSSGGNTVGVGASYQW
ncbi:trimeric autotransporter adhesin [Burkholderia pyrrocinia]|uniref:Trimeric autotransporter adhesin n=3 Tax=Burkholderia TaxID=32008 RepID=A0A318I6E0_BURPY|nr:trimeric autotransporter adhesin [Burkholderia pyrrocinia]SFW13130.1 Head domain of trimeric autotransporter adhesin [Burkholderia sp. NFACC33-1]